MVNKFQAAADNWDGSVPKTSVDPDLKAWLLAELADQYNLKCLVETGTANGDMTIKMASLFDKVFTFEIMSTYYANATENFRKERLQNIVAVNASSASPEFVQCVATLEEPTLFYLDAHYCGEGTGKDETIETPEVPVLNELKTIMKSPIDHVIVIDDARLFKGEEFFSEEENQYPSIEDIYEVVSSRYEVERVVDAFVVKP